MSHSIQEHWHELRHQRLIEILLPAFKASGLDVKEMDAAIAEIEAMYAGAALPGVGQGGARGDSNTSEDVLPAPSNHVDNLSAESAPEGDDNE